MNDDTAQFARITDLPNDESGNTFIYGHDRPAVFGALDNLQLGDEVKISTSNGYTFVYTFQNQQIINPDAIAILAPSQTPILIIPGRRDVR